jgi:hypothetical protein
VAGRNRRGDTGNPDGAITVLDFDFGQMARFEQFGKFTYQGRIDLNSGALWHDLSL